MPASCIGLDFDRILIPVETSCHKPLEIAVYIIAYL